MKPVEATTLRVERRGIQARTGGVVAASYVLLAAAEIRLASFERASRWGSWSDVGAWSSVFPFVLVATSLVGIALAVVVAHVRGRDLAWGALCLLLSIGSMLIAAATVKMMLDLAS